MTNDENHRIDKQVDADTTDQMLRKALESVGHDVAGIDAPRRLSHAAGQNSGARVMEGEATVQFAGDEWYSQKQVEFEVGPTVARSGGYDYSTMVVTAFVPKDNAEGGE